jgi:hypothetical protein
MLQIGIADPVSSPSRRTSSWLEFGNSGASQWDSPMENVNSFIVAEMKIKGLRLGPNVLGRTNKPAA